MAGLKKFTRWEYFPFVCLGLVLLLFHFTIQLGFGDDAVMAEIVAGRPMDSYLADIFQTWSSRITAHFFMVVFCVYLPGAVFRVVNTLLIVAIALCISKLIPVSDEHSSRRKVNWAVCALVLIYPMFHMATAGWIATSINYMWVLAFVLVALLPLKKLLSGKTFKWYESIVYAVALFLGANAEQGLAVLLVVYGVFFVYCLYKRQRLRGFLWVQLALLVISVIIFIASPGNAARLEVETAQYFPEFGSLSLLDKAGMGLTRTLDHFFFTPNAMVLCVGVLLIAASLAKQKDPLKRAVCCVPLVSTSVFALLLPITGNLFPGLLKMVEYYHISNTYEKDVSGFADATAGNNYLQFSNIIATVVLVFTFICLLVSIALIFGKNRQTLFLLTFVLACFAAVCAMGFSPTIYASAERTFLFMYAGLIVLGAALAAKLAEQKSRYLYGILFFMIGMAAVSFISGR
ncbi:MAG: DUF6056 family protein [Christensenellaceae bacterium]